MISRSCAKAIQKLRLNDASFQLRDGNLAALGFGFRCGFLGLFTSRSFRSG
jgi:translation elongation factor EF-4